MIIWAIILIEISNYCYRSVDKDNDPQINNSGKQLRADSRYFVTLSDSKSLILVKVILISVRNLIIFGL